MPPQFRFEVDAGSPFSVEERAEFERLVVSDRESTRWEAERDGLDVGDLLMWTQFDRGGSVLRASMSLSNSSYEAFELSLDHPNVVVVLFLDKFPERQSVQWRAWLDEIELVWTSWEEGWDIYRGISEWGEAFAESELSRPEVSPPVVPSTEAVVAARPEPKPFEAELGYSYGWQWSPGYDVVISGLHGVEYPWTEEYARELFASDFDHTKALSIFKFENPRRPSASLMIVPKTRSVTVTFFNDHGREELKYTFSNPGYTALTKKKFFPDASLVRDGQLFLSGVQAWSWQDSGGSQKLVSRDSRQFSSDGRTSFLVDHFDDERPGPPVEVVSLWGVDDSFDIVNTDGYWEPFPTEFGDWDRFFVRDRPGGVRTR